MNDKEWSQKDQENYDKYLKRFCNKFQDGLNEMKADTGFVFLFVRDTEEECIDIAKNMSDEIALFCLKEAIRLIESK